MADCAVPLVQIDGEASKRCSPVLHSCADESAEQRMWPVRSGAQLGMSLRGDEERVAWELEELDERPVR